MRSGLLGWVLAAMVLLELEHVSKRYGRGSGERVALDDVCLELHAGELAAVWGRRHSGRSTLLRVAAGVEAPDTGVVCFEGRNLRGRRARALGGVRYCWKTFRAGEGEVVLDLLVVGQLACGVSPVVARSRARAALKRAGVERCAALRPRELNSAEAVRVVIARALVLGPKLLVIDEPTIGVDLLARDGILLLLRSLADEGIAVLASAGETTGLSGTDRPLTLSKGELRGIPAPELPPVVSLHPSGHMIGRRVGGLRSDL
jgi:ABC-type multidrug transport system ATPase subunit